MTDARRSTQIHSTALRSHLSVFYLMLKSRIPALCGILLLLIGGEIVLFSPMLRRAVMGTFVGPSYLQALLEKGCVLWVFGLCLALLILLCGSFGLKRGSPTEYTLRRLSVSESALHLWQAFFTLTSLLLLYLLQLLLAYGMARWYVSAMSAVRPDAVGEQTAFLIFYESNLLHSLLPLHDTTRWISTATATLALSIAVSYFPFCRRQKKVPVIPCIVLLMYAVCICEEGVGRPGNDLVYAAAFVGTACHMIRIITRGGWRNEEEA